MLVGFMFLAMLIVDMQGETKWSKCVQPLVWNLMNVTNDETASADKVEDFAST